MRLSATETNVSCGSRPLLILSFPGACQVGDLDRTADGSLPMSMVLKDVDLVRLFGRAGAREAPDEEIVDGAHFGGVAGSRGSTTPMDP
jgi:hypothetical protein